MNPLRYRQVHLDFHTSEEVPSVGDRFDKKQFQEALKAGHVNSITVFSKCHHGWAYHPSVANEMHPKLKFDLLAAELEACREIGVNAPVYLSAGLDEKYAKRHPEHLNRPAPDCGYDFLNRAGYHLLCYNTPYLDTLVAQIEEVMQKYHPIGIFLDISAPRICYCQYCIASMRQKGLDPHNPADVRRHGDMVYAEYCRRTEEVIHKYNPDATIFHNAGNITRGRRDHAHFDTHLELESLPTGGWGYDHFPMSAAYCRTLGMEFLGMTGKFHTSWGEFGGFKHPNALRYEAALSIAEGAKCSIGDQLHPTGEMNPSTYRLIGKAYAEVEAKEPYVAGAKHITDIAILSAEAFTANPNRNCPYDVGASRILLEGKYLFNLVDQYEDLNAYKLLILPDVIRVDDALKARLNDYLAGGGKILCTGESGLNKEGSAFALDLGVRYEGDNPFCPTYMIPEYDAVNGRTAYVMYQPAKKVSVADGANVEALVEDIYFNRTPEHFCSHRHTPNDIGKDAPGAVLTANTGYIAWQLFADYADKGSLHLKELALHMIQALLDKPTVTVNLPDRGIVTFTKQESENRYVAHLLFAHTTKRGSGVEIIEDILPLYEIRMTALLPTAPKAVYKAEYDAAAGEIRKTPLTYTYEKGKASVEVGKVELHAMVIFEVE